MTLDKKMPETEWIPTLWEQKQDMDAHIEGVEISCSTSPFYDGVRYAVRRGGRRFVLNYDGCWEYEAAPSSRDTDFYERCRFLTFEEASNAADAIVRKGAEAEEKK